MRAQPAIFTPLPSDPVSPVLTALFVAGAPLSKFASAVCDLRQAARPATTDTIRIVQTSRGTAIPSGFAVAAVRTLVVVEAAAVRVGHRDLNGAAASHSAAHVSMVATAHQYLPDAQRTAPVQKENR
eukprot:SAG31_NODE_3376_length_4349_cov_1.760471_3_plen_127_part_00